MPTGESLRQTRRNEDKAAAAHETLEALLGEFCRRGVFATVGIELTIVDGTIQLIKRSIEQIDRTG